MIGYIPVSEATAWRREIEERALIKGLVTAEELQRDKPDWLERGSTVAETSRRRTSDEKRRIIGGANRVVG
jgi:hypothetical protein